MEHCHAVQQHMAEVCGNVALRECHGFPLSAGTDGDARSSPGMLATLYAEGASTYFWMPEIPHIPLQTDDFGMCRNLDTPPPLSM